MHVLLGDAFSQQTPLYVPVCKRVYCAAFYVKLLCATFQIFDLIQNRMRMCHSHSHVSNLFSRTVLAYQHIEPLLSHIAETLVRSWSNIVQVCMHVRA